MTQQTGGGGGMLNPMTTAGDLIVAGAAGVAARQVKGSDSTVLTTDPVTHLPAWDALTASMLPTLDKARYKTGTGQTLTNAAITIINFDTVDYDTNSLVTVGAAWKFTAKFAGKYRIAANVYLDNTTYAVGNNAVIMFYKNGAVYSQLMRPEVQSAGTYRLGLSGTDTVPLALNDTLDVRVQVNLNAGNGLTYNNNTFNFVSVELLP